MFVYLVIGGINWEGENVLGVFSDYDKAFELESKFVDSFDYTMIRKVEVDKVYEKIWDGIGEEV